MDISSSIVHASENKPYDSHRNNLNYRPEFRTILLANIPQYKHAATTTLLGSAQQRSWAMITISTLCLRRRKPPTFDEVTQHVPSSHPDSECHRRPHLSDNFPYACAPFGSQPCSAISKASIVNAGATEHPTKVQSPRLLACCHSPCSTITCGRSPAQRSFPNVTSLTGVPSFQASESRNGAPA